MLRPCKTHCVLGAGVSAAEGMWTELHGGVNVPALRDTRRAVMSFIIFKDMWSWREN